MHGLYREQRHAGSAPVSRDLAKHLYTRMMCGKVAVVTDKPASMLAAVRKQMPSLPILEYDTARRTLLYKSLLVRYNKLSELYEEKIEDEQARDIHTEE